MWLELFCGMAIAFLIISLETRRNRSLLLFSVRRIIRISDAIVKPIRNKLSNIRFSFGLSIPHLVVIFAAFFLIFQAFDAFEHLNQINAEASIFSRYYIQNYRIMQYLAANVLTVTGLALSNSTALTLLGIVSTILSGSAMAIVDQSRYSAIAFASFACIVLSEASRRSSQNSSGLKLLRKGTVRKSDLRNFVLIALITTFAIVLFLMTLATRMRAGVLLAYLSSFSFYSLGAASLSSINYEWPSFLLSITGIPSYFLGDVLFTDRVQAYQPIPGILQTSALLDSFFGGGLLLGLIISIPILIYAVHCHGKSSLIGIIMLFGTVVTFCQYDLRMSLRLIQISTLLFLLG